MRDVLVFGSISIGLAMGQARTIDGITAVCLCAQAGAIDGIIAIDGLAISPI